MKMPQPKSLSGLIGMLQTNPSPDWSLLEEAIYERLKKAAHKITQHSDGSVSFGATSLTHDAVIRLMTSNYLSKIRDSQHFFALMTIVMRQAFADHFRKRNAWKNGGRMTEIPFGLAIHGLEVSCQASYLEIDECMDLLEKEHPRQSRALSMQAILSLEVDEIAVALSVAKSTVEADLRFAKAYVRRLLESA